MTSCVLHGRVAGLTKLIKQLSAPATVVPNDNPPPRPVGADAVDASMAAARMRVREAAYTTLGHLAHRCPHAVASKIEIPRLLFSRLVSENKGMRLSIAEALSMVSPAYVRQGCGRVALRVVAAPVLTLVPCGVQLREPGGGNAGAPARAADTECDAGARLALRL